MGLKGNRVWQAAIWQSWHGEWWTREENRPRLAKRQDTTPHGQTEAGIERVRYRQRTMGRVWARGTPGWGRSTIFLFCVVKLGWIPPARPPFTEPLEEILLLVPAVLRPSSAPFWQLHCTGELHLLMHEQKSISTYLNIYFSLFHCNFSKITFKADVRRMRLGVANSNEAVGQTVATCFVMIFYPPDLWTLSYEGQSIHWADVQQVLNTISQSRKRGSLQPVAWRHVNIKGCTWTTDAAEQRKV